MGEPYATQFEPVALRGKVVRLEPDGTLRRVQAVEQVGEIGPLDILAEADSDSNSVGADGETGAISIADMETEKHQVAQYRVDVLSKMRLRPRQPRDESRRMTVAGGQTELTMATPSQHREVFVNEDDSMQFIVSNPNKYALGKALMNAVGFKLKFEPDELSSGQVDKQPISFPIGSLSSNTQGTGGTTGRMTQGVGGR